MLSMNNMVCLTRKEVFNSEKKEFVENNQGGGMSTVYMDEKYVQHFERCLTRRM